MITLTTIHAAFNLLLAMQQGRLYAIIDACGHEMEIPSWAEKLGAEQAICLYDGKAAIDHRFYAPYLFKVNEQVRQIIWQNVWEDAGWGYFLIADPNSTLISLRRHFKRWLRINIDEAENVLFRFYDPRVLTAVLDSAGPVNNTVFLGPQQTVITVSQNTAARVWRNPAIANIKIRQPIGQRYHIGGETRTALNNMTFDNTVQNMLHYVHQEAPEHHPNSASALPDYMQTNMVKGAIAAAKALNIDATEDLQQWVLLHFVYGADFAEELPWAAAIMQQPSLSGTERIKQLLLASFAHPVETAPPITTN